MFVASSYSPFGIFHSCVRWCSSRRPFRLQVPRPSRTVDEWLSAFSRIATLFGRGEGSCLRVEFYLGKRSGVGERPILSLRTRALSFYPAGRLGSPANRDRRMVTRDFSPLASWSAKLPLLEPEVIEYVDAHTWLGPGKAVPRRPGLCVGADVRHGTCGVPIVLSSTQGSKERNGCTRNTSVTRSLVVHAAVYANISVATW